MQLTQELVKELFDYKDGFLYYKIKPRNGINIGDIAGCLHKQKSGDRYSIGLKGNDYLNSRLVFLWHKGYLPDIIDHKDRNQMNDKIENLREATYTQNSTNTSKRKNASSQYLGVSYIKNNKKYRAAIRINKIGFSLGYYKTEIEAAMAYNESAKVHHGEFANLNIINF